MTFHLFLHMKLFLDTQNFDKEKDAVNTWLQSQVAFFYNKEIQKLVPHYDKYLNDGGNYVEK